MSWTQEVPDLHVAGHGVNMARNCHFLLTLSCSSSGPLLLREDAGLAAAMVPPPFCYHISCNQVLCYFNLQSHKIKL